MSEDQRFEELRGVVADVSRETFADLVAFESLFRKWAPSINLAAPSTIANHWTRHIVDCAQLVALKPNARRWLDLGSGGGFPGLVIAILQKGRDGARVDLVESVGKKAAFLRLAAGTLGLPATVHQCRIEAAASQIATPEIVTARALAALPRLFELSEQWLADGATGLFQKGRDYRREVEASRYAWTFDLVEHPSVTEPDAAILEIAGLKRQVAGRST